MNFVAKRNCLPFHWVIILNTWAAGARKTHKDTDNFVTVGDPVKSTQI
jgi:hypothetical protein